MKPFIMMMLGLSMNLLFTPVTGQQFYMYTGSYTATEDEGINVYDFSASKPSLNFLFTVKGIKDPSYIIIHPSGKYLYAVNELMTYQGRPSGSVSAFAIDPSDGNLTFLNTRPTGGTAPCHLTLDPSGKWLFVANYGSGNVSVFPLNEDGTIGESTDLIQHHGKGTNPERQEGPHAHQVVFDKNHDLLFVNDLGLDKVFMYRFNHTTGKLSPASPPWFRTPPGFGPRHLAIGKKGKTIYVLGEMASSVSVFTFSPGSQPEEIQEISMLPEEFNGENTGAEIVLSPDGKFLFASNRGDNSLAEYSIDPGSGKLKLNHFYSSGGIDPRFFCFDPTGKYIFSANQTSENIIVYKYNKTNGELTPTGIEIKLPKPVCMAFLHK